MNAKMREWLCASDKIGRAEDDIRIAIEIRKAGSTTVEGVARSRTEH